MLKQHVAKPSRIPVQYIHYTAPNTSPPDPLSSGVRRSGPVSQCFAFRADSYGGLGSAVPCRAVGSRSASPSTRKMAAPRSSMRSLTRALGRDVAIVKDLRRYLSLLSLSNAANPTQQQSSNSNAFQSSAGRVSQGFERRHFRASPSTRKMAAPRSSMRSLTRALGRDVAIVKDLRRYLSLLSLSNAANPTQQQSSNSNAFQSSAGRVSQGFERRHFRASVQGNQQSELETDDAASDSAQGFQPVPLPLRNYSPVLSGFSVLPNTAVGVPAGLSPPSSAGNLNLDQLGKEMSNFLSHGRFEEVVRLFEDWLKFPDVRGKAKVPNVMAYNLLLHAKLRLGGEPRHMLQVIKDMVQIIKDMQMSGLKPNTLSYNFLLRAYFRQRDSKNAERTLDVMEQSGPEAQPDGDSYNFVVVLCALDRRVDAAMYRFQTMIARGYIPSKTTYNELLLSAGRMQRSRAAVEILKDLKRRNIVPQLHTIVEIAMNAAEEDDAECAIQALELLSTTELANSAKNLSMDEGGMYYLLSTAARVASPTLSAQAWSILRNSLRGTKLPSPASYLARIHALASTGDVDSAFATLRELESVVGKSPQAGDREILSPFSSLRPLVLACSRGGFAALDAVYYKLAEMNAGGQPVTLSAVNCVIQGCANTWDFDRAYQTFETIGTTFGLLPDVHSCNSLLDVFGKTRKTPEVLQIFDYMHEVGVVPDERTYCLLVDAHVVNRDPKAAMDALHALTSAGHVPQRRTLMNILRRCVKEDDKEGISEIKCIVKDLGHREVSTNLGRWTQLVPFTSL